MTTKETINRTGLEPQNLTEISEVSTELSTNSINNTVTTTIANDSNPIQEVQVLQDSIQNVKTTINKITSIDNLISRFLDDVKKSSTIDYTSLQKSQAIFMLDRLRLGLMFTDRIGKLLEVQFETESRIFNPTVLDQLGMKEVMVIYGMLNNSINNYYYKINEIMNSIDIKELESMILMITEVDNRNRLASETSQLSTSADTKGLAFELIELIGQVKSETLNPSQEQLDQLDSSEKVISA